MRHLGDISKICGAEIEPVDIITFGSPCQDLSVAGKRAGLKGERSGLFMEAVRIIKEMREATNGKYPTFALWENVPGAFSSNNGEDFRIVLEELIKIVEPGAVMPAVPPFGWAYADSYVGDGWSIAYRVFDAQYWPRTPQRRRRIHLVTDFRGQRARKVLFEREGVRGDFAPSRAPRKETPAGTGDCAAGGSGKGTVTYIIDSIGGQSEYGKASDVSSTLRAATQNAVAYDVNRAREATVSTTLDTTEPYPNKNQGGIAIMEKEESQAQYHVRRLTPTECARLQGFADCWGDLEEKSSFAPEEYNFWLEVRNTHAAINGRKTKDYSEAQMLAWYNKLHSDSAEYKMWGNGIAIPPALYCMQGMAEVLKEGGNG